MRALVVGLGGLGCPASLALAQAGVRHFTLIDPDMAELTNLPRQLWPRTQDIGKPKVVCAREGLERAFEGLEIRSHIESVDQRNVHPLVRGHDVVLDGTDDWRTKLLLSDAAVATGVPLVYAGVLRWSGQVMKVSRRGVCLRCLFEAPEGLPTCAQAGVMGSVAGVVGALQAMVALEACGAPESPKGQGRLLIWDAETMRQRAVTVRRAEDCRHG